MNQLHLWQLSVDVAFVITLMFVSARWLKAGKSSDVLPKTAELEISLRALLADAESSSRTLTDQLRERQSALDRTLREIQSAEDKLLELPKIEAVIAKGSKIAASIEQLITGVREELNSTKLPEPKVETLANSGQAQRLSQQFEPVKNIARVERLAPTSTSSNPEARSIVEMKQVYQRAEELLKAGSNISKVSQVTEIPESEIRLLSQMIEVERESQQPNEQSKQADLKSDLRLGVLSGMRRNTATL